ncbi:hypothetical protein ACIBHY_54045 [Nonomuraea sp. NPDC050547]|uniref:hypothetical protein n=1 Tax=Nonomuraea sp. NPDC050547 TaxID=3364368 RepID=UPI0037A3947C
MSALPVPYVTAWPRPGTWLVLWLPYHARYEAFHMGDPARTRTVHAPTLSALGARMAEATLDIWWAAQAPRRIPADPTAAALLPAPPARPDDGRALCGSRPVLARPGDAREAGALACPQGSRGMQARPSRHRQPGRNRPGPTARGAGAGYPAGLAGDPR